VAVSLTEQPCLTYSVAAEAQIRPGKAASESLSLTTLILVKRGDRRNPSQRKISSLIRRLKWLQQRRISGKWRRQPDLPKLWLSIKANSQSGERCEGRRRQQWRQQSERSLAAREAWQYQPFSYQGSLQPSKAYYILSCGKLINIKAEKASGGQKSEKHSGRRESGRKIKTMAEENSDGWKISKACGWRQRRDGERHLVTSILKS